MAYTFQMLLDYPTKYSCGLWACAGQLCVSGVLTIRIARIDLYLQTTATHMLRFEDPANYNQTYMCSVK